MIKPQIKLYTPAVAKIRGTFTSTSKNVQINPALTADDFDYPVPKGVRLTQMPGAAPAARVPVRAPANATPRPAAPAANVAPRPSPPAQ